MHILASSYVGPTGCTYVLPQVAISGNTQSRTQPAFIDGESVADTRPASAYR